MTWRIFSTGQCTLLKILSFYWRQIIQGKSLLRNNHMWLNRLSVLHNGWSKKHCIIEKDFRGMGFLLLAKSCQMMLANASPPVLSQWTTVEHVFNGFHWPGTTMRATLVNLHRDFTTPFINHDHLMDDRPKESRLFLYLSFMPVTFVNLMDFVWWLQTY